MTTTDRGGGIGSDLALEGLSPSRLWSALDDAVRREAATALYRNDTPERRWRREADQAIASAIRFRPAAVRSLPVERRIGYLLGPVRPDDSLAGTLLLALHLTARRRLLEDFLDRLEIPQQGGLIADDHDLRAPDPKRLADAVDATYATHPAGPVEVYLATLLAMDPDVWEGLAELLAPRLGRHPDRDIGGPSRS